MKVSRRIVLRFPPLVTGQPVTYKLAREYDLVFNILKATVSPGQEGQMMLDLTGEKANYDRGMKYLKEIGVEVQPLSQDVIRDESRCTHCGACVAICPAQAFTVDPETRKVLFNDERCVLCGLCVKACPPRAMNIIF